MEFADSPVSEKSFPPCSHATFAAAGVATESPQVAVRVASVCVGFVVSYTHSIVKLGSCHV